MGKCGEPEVDQLPRPDPVTPAARAIAATVVPGAFGEGDDPVGGVNVPEIDRGPQLAVIPIVSIVGATGMTPSSGAQPAVGLNPTTPL